VGRRKNIEAAKRLGVFRDGRRIGLVTEQELEAIYAQIPEMQCVEGCNLCCRNGVPVSKLEQERIEKYGKEHGIEIVTKGTFFGQCPYQLVRGCAIYPVRPLMCRLFGCSDRKDLTCYKGISPEHNTPPSKKLPESVSRDMYMRVMGMV
jgi:hypothetical protein